MPAFNGTESHMNSSTIEVNRTEAVAPKNRELLRLGWTAFWLISFVVIVLVYTRVESRRLPKPTTIQSVSSGSARPRTDDQFQLALKALEVNDLDGVELQLEALRKITGKESRVRFLEGALLLKRNKLDEAIQQLSPLGNNGELKGQSLTLLGEAFFKLGRFQQAHVVLNRALQEDPKLVDAHRWLAVLYHDLGAMEHAIQHLSEVGKLAPRDPRPYRLMGRINKEYERYQFAVDNYKECLRRDPLQKDWDQIQLELATSQIRIRQYQDAFDVLSSLSDSTEKLALVAECQRGLGKVDEASATLKRSLEMDPDHLPSLLLVGEIAQSKADWNAAAQSFRQAVDKYPMDDAAKYQLALVLRRLGQEAEAEKLMAESQQIKAKREKLFELHLDAIQRPYDAELRYEMATMFVDMKLPETANQWLRAVLAIDPNHQKARELAESLAKQTKSEKESRTSSPAP